ncbi:hypothetical protein F2Q70_00037496 [Brassica cretica]|uniref:DUF4283 domain-containing protein n=1 Tax=Brassica cretica TaxID=69181 RepID=A0A8S9JY13_BRACR|nr:hypothetical protein F2Q70_00037496 [Brassica cretica]
MVTAMAASLGFSIHLGIDLHLQIQELGGFRSILSGFNRSDNPLGLCGFFECINAVGSAGSMNRHRKKKEMSLLEELRDLELLEVGEMVGGLVKALPPNWGLEDRVRGRGVGENMAQFIFNCNSDLHHILTRSPWFVNGWIVVMDQWLPNPGPEFLHRIPFWVRIRGIPIHLLKKQAVESLMGPLGKVEKVEQHAKNSSSVEYVRALVQINTEEPLQFRRTARFKS